MSELKKIKETFVDPLLHPLSSTSVSNTPHSGAIPGDSQGHDRNSDAIPSESSEHLPIFHRPTLPPIASRCATPVSQSAERGGDLNDDLTEEVSVHGMAEADDVGVFHETLKDCTPESVPLPAAIPPHQLPEDLRACLEAFENSFLENHTWFSEAIKKRYEERCPLMPSTKDILVSYVRYLPRFICHCLTCPLAPYSNRLHQIHVSSRESC